VALLIRPFLGKRDRRTVSVLNTSWHQWELFGDCPLASPSIPFRRRLHGFGKVNRNLHIRHTSPSPYFILHMSWGFLTFEERATLAEASPAFEAYARLRRSSATVSISVLRDPRPPPSDFQGLQHDRAWRMAVLLIRFDFSVGDSVRWMEGEYTNKHRDWTTFSDAINAVRSIEPYPGDPPVDFDRAYRVCTEGVPLAGSYECSFDSVRQRNLYDNHPGLEAVADDVRDKLAKEEAQSFHIALPRFIWRFILGIHIAPMVWNIRKGKGRLCIDPSNRISEDDDGNANASIPAPGEDDREDECPSVHYARALHRHLTYVWNLRITHPDEDILQFVDDIQAAFHRVLYNPDAMVLFASVFQEFLILAVGTIFGARNSPSFFSLLSESRSAIASIRVYRPNDEPSNLTPLARRVRLIPAPTEHERRAIVPAVADACHLGVPSEFADRYHNATFVDDNATAAIRGRISGAIDNSVCAAYDVFGHPDSDRRQPCFAADKWMMIASFAVVYLGFFIDSRQMVMSWPVEKRRQLAELLDTLLARTPCIVTPRESSSLLGLIRNAAPVAPLGIYLSMRVQHDLNDGITAVWNCGGSHPPLWWKRWYRRHHLILGEQTVQDLQVLRSTLDDNEHHPVWTRDIALLVNREITHSCSSDASYSGLGAWSPSDQFNFMWRITREDLIRAGFDMKSIDANTSEPDGTVDGHHINVLEFICLIIELWFVILLIANSGPRVGGYIVCLVTDNTSALSWLRYASRSHRPIVRALARFAVQLTMSSPFPLKLSGRHLKGILNKGADALSRPLEFPTWASAIEQHSPLATCQPYRVPFEMLVEIATLITKAETGEAYEPEMTRLLTPVLTTLNIGSSGNSVHSSVSRVSRRTTRSR